MALFSATMPGPIRQIARKHLKDPADITIAQRTAAADTINQRYIVAAPHQKQAALARILEAEPTDGVLVFVKTRSATEPLAEYLAQAGLKSAALNGDFAQKQRERIVENDVPLELIAASLAVLVNRETPLFVKDELRRASFTGDSRRDPSDSRSRSRRREFQMDRRTGSHCTAAGMETYRIEVGRSHQVQPGNIVGAIANEAGIGSESIGKINIFDRFSTVDLPEGFPPDLLDALQNVFVAGRRLRISRMDDSPPRPARYQGGKRPFHKSKSKPKHRKTVGHPD